jgi:hypothetical protein
MALGTLPCSSRPASDIPRSTTLSPSVIVSVSLFTPPVVLGGSPFLRAR